MSHRGLTSDKRVRRFLPEPVETSSRSSRDPKATFRETSPSTQKGSRGSNEQSPKPKNISPVNEAVSLTVPTGVAREDQQFKGESRSVGPRNSVLLFPRKFTPQLVETGQRSFRRQQMRHIHHSESIPEALPRNINHEGIRDQFADDVTGIEESWFSYANLQRRQETRRHSFRIPDLPAIPSSCSEDSDDSEVSPRPPSFSAAHCGPSVKQKTHINERHASQLSEYVVALAAHSAENQLKEQALAAFPNEQVYQPVDHFAVDREDDDSSKDEKLQVRTDIFTPGIHRRASSADLPWELEYLRRHKEEAEMCDRAMAGTKGLHFSPTDRRPFDGASVSCGNWAGGFGLTQIKPGISPPMLGEDLVFPQSVSPEATICESSNVEHYVTQDKQYHNAGLWYADRHLFDDSDGGGLWMGTCKSNKRLSHLEDSQSSSPRSSGDAGEYPQCSTQTSHIKGYENRSLLDSSRDPESLDSRHTRQHASDQDLDHELTDSFVTQIYNYLSLGYPCVARYYDHELSIISGISVADLRRDDLKTDAKGYVSVMDEGPTDRKVEKGLCMRWMALRLYIQEWARKRPKMADDGIHGAWGVCERKGSWAI
ncbi:uncharacterized protein BO88DRAFT_441113 [Aspergillus vadensis CBS 113365]|uniref:Uncharacterized protein n=1 Tax=Aspergillus vadensis (strain CBS 113365 / IMI 142717 / IBT 24658) TaxID=1448311 RepID=A0A319BNV8_ASPVC|nr:hypothetical protein BO88DRAFT_441113 [Aspergillus vadensis CBS 113365]PYH74034.1 hypothetical protein BO88DRAFT_441113 [Aspergillus vadensis CBS 113365]